MKIFFEIIDSEAKAYFFGLLTADGCLCKGNNSVRLTLQDRDKEILELFNQELNYNRSLFFREKSLNSWNKRDSYLLEVSSAKFRKDLEKQGLTTRKSLTLIFPKKFPKKFISHYICGYFDGDGCIYNGGKVYHVASVMIAGNINYCTELTYLLNNTNISSRTTKHTNQNCYYTIINGSNNVLKFIIQK
jgi:hypothetical protein